MLDEYDIIKKSTRLGKPIISGVYFLVHNINKIVYIGSSNDIHNRIKMHTRGMFKKKKIFNSYYFIEVLNEKEYRNLEVEYIKKFQPRYNVLYCEKKATPTE